MSEHPPPTDDGPPVVYELMKKCGIIAGLLLVFAGCHAARPGYQLDRLACALGGHDYRVASASACKRFAEVPKVELFGSPFDGLARLATRDEEDGAYLSFELVPLAAEVAEKSARGQVKAKLLDLQERVGELRYSCPGDAFDKLSGVRAYLDVLLDGADTRPAAETERGYRRVKDALDAYEAPKAAQELARE